jgi:hypothetical protein
VWRADVAVEIFKADDDGYKRWTRTHPDGYVLTKSSKDYSIHHSGCDAIFWPLGTDRMTSAEKVCSDKPAELDRYSLEKTKLRPIYGCEQCGS